MVDNTSKSTTEESKVFFSRFTLKFFSNELEEEYTKHMIYNSFNQKFTNIVISGILIILSIILLKEVDNPDFPSDSYYPIIFIILIVNPCLIMIILILYIFNKNKSMKFILKYQDTIHNLFNFYSLGLITHSSLGILFYLNYPLGYLILIIVLFLIVTIFYVYFLMSFLVFFISYCLIFLTHWAVILKLLTIIDITNQNTQTQGGNVFFYILGYYLFLSGLGILGYIIEITLRINYFVIKHFSKNDKHNKRTGTVVHNLKNSFFIVNSKTGKLKYMNKAHTNMLNNLENLEKNAENDTTQEHLIKEEKK